MDEKRPQVALVGFMGTGKTTIGPILAADLGLGFIDLDELLVARTGLAIPAIFAHQGEAGFRSLERDILAEVAGRAGQVLATGGGAILDPTNTRLLRATGSIVALTSSPAAILQRVGGERERPLLAGLDQADTITRLLAEREPLYRAAADLVLDTSDLTPVEASRSIAAWCRRTWQEGERG